MSDAPASGERSTIGDAAARIRIRDDLATTFVVEAAAGTGKTTMLVSRIVAVLAEGRTTLDRIVAVTFTEKAAGEMKLRLRAALETARTDPEAAPERKSRLDAALAHLELARIGTIHSLCADLLRERPVEAKVDPLFEVTAEDEAERLFEGAFEQWFQNALRAPGEGVRRMLRRRARGRDRVGPRDALRDAAWKLVGHRDFSAPWRRDPFDREGHADRLLERLGTLAPFAARAERDDDFLGQNFQKVERYLAELGRREAVRVSAGGPGRDYDGLEAELAEVARWKDWRWRGMGTFYAPGLKRSDLLAERDAVKEDIDTFLEQANADLAACLKVELTPLAGRYAELKARAGKLDFLDLLLGARDLLRDNAVVRNELQVRFSHLFVDEFQDTDPLQAEILLLLAASDPAENQASSATPIPGKLFLVGDPKQSIYRFRRADVALYESIKARLLTRGAELLYLTVSYRSVPSIQTAINAAFAPVMTGNAEGTQARYVALEAHRADVEGQPSVVVLPVPRPYSDWGKLTDWSVERSLPDAVGAFVDFLVRRSGFRVQERDGTMVPVAARHVCLLFKRFQRFGDDITRAYVRALEARRVPHVLVGGRSFHDREEVQAVKNAVSAVEWPDDELSVYATLRGPFFALGDDALLAFRHQFKNLHPLSRHDPAVLTTFTLPVAEALSILGDFHKFRNRRPIADTLGSILRVTRAHAGLAIWPTGEQALANVLRVMDLARRFESSGASSFRAFADFLNDDAGGQAGEAPVVEEGTEGVRIMTVHRAKGLEFPVVVLADPTAPTIQTLPSRFVDQERGVWAEALAGLMPAELADRKEYVLERDREEAVRVAYVAATRARDLLVVPGVGDGELEGWLDVLHPVVHPEKRAYRSPGASPGCPLFGADTVFERPSKARGHTSTAVAPGLHIPRAGAHRVVWWDPASLELDREPEGGVRQQRILAADETKTRSLEGAASHRAWLAKRDALLAAGGTPTLVVRTATEIANEVVDGGPALLVHEATSATRTERPHGKRFGSLVHAVLAEIDLGGNEEAVRRVATAQGRLLGATADEVIAAGAAAVAALDHAILRRARKSAERGECRREVPVLLPQADGSIVEGIVDLAFREEGAWVVVDFKTDVELTERRAKYETQVLLYVKAISEATGDAASGVLLSV